MANIAVITGASSGLGVKFLEAVVKRYPQMDEYWILARRKERLDKLVEKYENKKVVAIEVDLSNESSYDELIKRLENEKPKVKVLINNAKYEKSGNFANMRQEDILNMISVNIKGMTLIQRIILPYMQKGSYTIITCSVSSFVPVPNQTVYSATKKYVYYFGKALREELLDKDINIILLCPGNMDTEMNPKGQGRQSRKINQLPFLDLSEITAKTLEKAESCFCVDCILQISFSSYRISLSFNQSFVKKNQKHFNQFTMSLLFCVILFYRFFLPLYLPLSELVNPYGKI